SVHGLNRILEAEAREPACYFSRAESLHANARSLRGAARVVARAHPVGRKPGFDDDDAIRLQMVPEAAQRLRDAIERVQVADRAAQAKDGIVPMGKQKTAHVRLEESPGGVLRTRNPEKIWTQVQSIHGESVEA